MKIKLSELKKLLVLLFIVFISIGCSENKITNTQLVEKYYDGFQSSNFLQVKNVIDDSLTTVYGDYITNFTKEKYYKQFKWDSVFKPDYKLISLKKSETAIMATVSISCSKFEFLKNNPMICNYEFQFKAGKITRIEELNCDNVNWDVWENQVNDLVHWVEINHPELDGFVHDLSLQGAQNYLKAIALYNAQH
ncbi:hypothetical protein [uncultured Winogradskyella sp.]|uniref:hypothetical protein n=1 Tax=uncultured Winogradskyella sp. TaxID=395353 RepID=UPI0026237994|nr:hypothetical protein [uncultured Winogradskyella sp.]